MRLLWRRCGPGLLLLLLLTARLLAAQQLPATQQKLDARFLRERGIASLRSSQSLVAARQQAAHLRTEARNGGPHPHNVSTTTWQAAGPVQLATAAYGLVTGRVSSLAVDPNDASGNTVYLGATGGGVWKSTNAAGNAATATFLPLTDDLSFFANSDVSVPSLSIGALTVQPGNSEVLLAGTGDPNDALDSYYGVGILRSTNGGQSWTLIQQSSDGIVDGTNYPFAGLGMAQFAWSTATPNLVVVAASQSLEGELVNPPFATTAEEGLYYSSDAGQTWHLATITDGANEIVQAASQEAAPPGNAATAVVWNAKRGLFVAAIRFHGYYSSPDGMTWTRLANQPSPNLSATNCPANPGGTGSQSCPIFRGSLAVQPVTGDTFALTTDVNNVDQGLFEDVCAAHGGSCSSSTVLFGTEIADAALDSPSGAIAEADYSLTLAAVPSQQDTLLFAGTTDIFRCSLANSCTWRNTTNTTTCAAAAVAPSAHAMDGTYGASGLMFFGTDGGLWRTTDDVAETGSVCAATDASHFQNMNGGIGSLAEISHLAVSQANPSLMLAGAGEFGVVASESAAAQGGTGSWQQLLTGEGSYVAIDPDTPSNWYAGNGAGVSIFSCAEGGSCTPSLFGTSAAVGRADVDDDADYLLEPSPWILDPSNPDSFFVGTCRIWRGPVTGGWSASDLVSGVLDVGGGTSCDGNAAVRSLGAGGTYNSTTGEAVYAGMAGPLDGGGTMPGHLFGASVPTGAGTVTWTDLWRNPVTNTSMTTQFNGSSGAISSIAVDPHDPSGLTVYAGISVFPTGQSGVLYRSTDGGAHWANITNSLPFAPVNRVVVDPVSAGTVYVAGDFGVYYTTSVASCVATGTAWQNCWSVLGAGLPNAPVTDLKVAASGSSSVIEAATYGRGIWTLGLAETPAYAQATLTPGSYTYPATGVGTTATSTAVFLLANTGPVPLAVLNVSVSGDFTETNTCSGAVAVGGSCSVSVLFRPSATGVRSGVLTVNANTAAGVLTASLNGTGVTAGSLTLSPGTLVFPLTAAGAVSPSSTVTVANTGGAPVSLSTIGITGADPLDFSMASGGSCGATLPAGGSCSIPVIFSPVATGSLAAQLEVQGSASGSPFFVSLQGTSVAPASLSLYPTSLTFPSTPENSTSSAVTLNLTNSGGIAAQLGTATVSGDYLIQSNGCGASLAPEVSCSVAIAFHPTALGARAGLFTVPSSSIPAGQVTAALSGTGGSPISVALTPTALLFPASQVGIASAPLPITVNNTGSVAAPLGSTTVTGDFSVQSTTCGSTLAAGANCSLSLVFTPTVIGARTGTVTLPVSSNSLAATLSGTGTAPPTLLFNPASLAFAATAENATSAPQTVALSNTGGNPLLISGTGVTGPFAVSPGSCPVSPATLAVGSTCNMQVTFAPTAVGASSGALTVTGNFTNSPAPLPLSGTGAAPPAASLAPTSLSYPDTAVGTVSASQTITVNSNGGLPVTFGAATVSSGFQITADTCTGSLAPGGFCSVSILFQPAATGTQHGTFQLDGTMAGGSLSATLTGSGLPPGVLSVTPLALAFGTVAIGSESAAQTLTAANTGGAPLTLGAPTINTGDYVVAASTCGATLAAGQSCTLNVAFQPTASGSRPAQLTLSSGTASPATVTLAGTGATPGQLQFSPASLGFGTVAEGSSSTLTTTATNSGGIALHLLSMSAGGDFTLAGGTCALGEALAPGASCTVAIAFAPSAAGTRAGTLTIADDGSPATTQVALAGVGVTPGTVLLSPSSLAFGTTVLGAPAPAQSVTASNPGGTPVALSTASVTGPFAIAGDTCGASLASGATCTIQVVFSPTTPGAATGIVSLPGQYLASPATVQLGGTGVTPGALAFSPSPIVLNAVAGSTTSSTVVLSNTGGAPVQLSGVSVSAGFSLQSQCGSTLAPGGSCNVTVSYTPVAAGNLAGLLTASGSVSAATDAIAASAVLPGSLSASPASVSFPSTVLGSTSAAATVTFTDGGGVPVPLSAPSVSSADYSIVSTSCGAAIAAGASCTASVLFHPTAAGDRAATLLLAGSVSGGPAVKVALDGTGLQPAALGWTPTTLTFGPTADRTTSPPQTLTLTNTGGIATPIGAPVLTGEYLISANSCGTSLAAGATCAIAVEFAPVADGVEAGTLAIAAPRGTPAATAALSGTGAALAALPTSVIFPGSLLVGTTSAPVGISIENLGTNPVPLSAPALGGDFAISSSTCGSTLAADTSCTVMVTFTPTSSGPRTGSLSYTDGGETVTVALSGTGLSPATDSLSPAVLSFSGTEVGSVSTPLPVVLTNGGDATLNGISVSISGPFLVSNNCGASLGGHLSCATAVAFAPVTLGAATGVLTVVDALRTQTVALSGQGLAPPQPIASPNNITFGAYALNATTAVQQVTISNQGGTPMTALAASIAGTGFLIAASNCPADLAAGAACQIGITFTPLSIGNQEGVLSVTSTSLSEPLAVALSGSGEDFQLAPVGTGSDVITPGQTATYQLAITPVGSSSGTLALVCLSGVPANATCSINPSTIAVTGGSSGSATVTLVTSGTATATTTAEADPPAHWREAACAILCFCPWFLRSRAMRRHWLLLFLAALMVSGPVACGVHASGVSNGAGNAPPGTTPGGSYSITVAGSFPGAQRTATLQLTVQ